jgi:hypothetical protein
MAAKSLLSVFAFRTQLNKHANTKQGGAGKKTKRYF